MRTPYKMRKVVKEFKVHSKYADVMLPREELECGHVIRSHEPSSTAEAISALGYAISGESRKRRCYQCGKS